MSTIPRRGRVAAYETQPLFTLDDRRLELPVGAYSLRRVLSAYAGPCVRVRRTPDNLEADIRFGNDGWIDTNALLTHCAGGSGFVTTRYDHGTRAAHQIQPTLARQLRIVNAGVVETTAGGKPCLRNGSATLQGMFGPVQVPGYTGKGSAFASVCLIPSGGNFCRIAAFTKDGNADNSATTTAGLLIQNAATAQAGIFRVGSVGYAPTTLGQLVAYSVRTTGLRSLVVSSQGTANVAGSLPYDVNRMLCGLIDGGNLSAGISVGALICEDIGWWRDVGPAAADYLRADQIAAWGSL